MGYQTRPDIRPLHNRILVGDCLTELKKIPTGSVDLVFADPPYERDFVDPVLRRVATLGILGEGGCFILQHSRREDLSDPGEGRLRRVDHRMYGDTVLSLFSVS